MTTWQENASHASAKPAEGFELSVTKWSKCWHWAIDTDPSAILRMDHSGPCSRITFLDHNATYIAQGQARTKDAAKKMAETAWKELQT